MDSGAAPAVELVAIAAVGGVRSLAEGVLNRNWRVEAGGEVFALKELVETGAEAARRSLAVMAAAGEAGVPVVSVVPGVGGESVTEVGGHFYYLARWVEGDHRRGPR
nr:hypothetical protein GCM10025732_08550 [Glycomyces mayteni]